MKCSGFFTCNIGIDSETTIGFPSIHEFGRMPDSLFLIIRLEEFFVVQHPAVLVMDLRKQNIYKRVYFFPQLSTLKGMFSFIFCFQRKIFIKGKKISPSLP